MLLTGSGKDPSTTTAFHSINIKCSACQITKLDVMGCQKVKDICYQIKNGVFPMRGTRVLSEIT